MAVADGAGTDEGVTRPTKNVVWFKGQNFPEARDNAVELSCRPADDAAPELHDVNVTVTVPASFTKFNLQPVHYGPSVVYLNAQDDGFYNQTLREPTIKVWVLGKTDDTVGYVRRRLWEASFSRNIALKFVATYRFDLFAGVNGLEDMLYDGTKVGSMPDVVLVRTGATIDYFGMAVLRQIETMGITVLNGCQSIEISRDKLQTMQVMAAHGLPIAKTLLAKFPINFDVVEAHFNYPIIVKKSSGAQGKGITLVKDHDSLEDLCDLLDPTEPLIFQEFLSHSKGRNLRVLVVGGRVIASMMRVANKGFKANDDGSSVRAVKVSPQVEWLVLEATRLTGLDVATIDLLIDKDTYKICDINSAPGFQDLESATGFDVASSMLSYIKMRMGLYRFPHLKNSGKSHQPLSISVEDDHRSPVSIHPT
ncbi:N-acetylaspartylglutamate synthase [Plasmodiophora brassicae]|nr:hypothetical protein PBRA_004211 [Plasmodiophora brassicae]